MDFGFKKVATSIEFGDELGSFLSFTIGRVGKTPKFFELFAESEFEF